MKSVKVSIIVPVYNVEAYLGKCIESIKKQSFRDLEIILVNDGSTDSSGEICEIYAQMDNRITVIHQKNFGLSEARNVGIRKAIGKYVLFVDSDDFIENNACEKFYDIAENNQFEIVTGSFKNIRNSECYYVKNYNSNGRVYSGLDYLRNQFRTKIYLPNAYLLFVLRCFLVENKLFFEKGIYHEDEEWTPRVLVQARRVIGTGYCFYNRLVRENSIMTQSYKAKHYKDYIKVVEKTIKFISKIDDEEIKNYIYDYMINLYFISVFSLKKYYGLHSDLIDRKIGMLYSRSLKNKIYAYVLSEFGVKAFMHLFCFKSSIGKFLKTTS